MYSCSVILKPTQISLGLRDMQKSPPVFEDDWKTLKTAVIFYVEI